MNLRLWLTRVENFRLLMRAQMAIAVGATLAAAWWGASFLIFTTRIKANEQSSKQHITEISDARRKVAAAETITSRNQPEGMKAVSAFQTALDKAARSHECELTEFQATAEVAAYLSKFKKITDKSDWLQVPVHVSMTGTVSALMGTFESLKGSDVPFEFDSIALTRGQVLDNNEVNVTAKIEMRVLIKQGAS